MKRNKQKAYMYGKHSLEEALESAPHAIKKVFLSLDANEKVLRDKLAKYAIPVNMLKSGREADRMVGADTAHQGVIAVIDTDALIVDFKDFTKALSPSADTCLVLLDELTDPHNVGAIIRSAAAFGASGVLIPVHNQAPITGAVVKSSAGMVFRIPLISIGNVNYAIDKLKDLGFWTYALAMDGQKITQEEDFSKPSLFVIGNEGRGIRQKTLERCDTTLRIPMHPRCESLNASVSTAIVLYQWSVQHKNSLR